MTESQRKALTDEQLQKEIKATKDTLQGMFKQDPDRKILKSILYYLEREQQQRIIDKKFHQLKLF